MDSVLLSAAISLGPFILLILVGIVFGTVAQRQHIADLDRREQALGQMLLTSIATHDGARSELVTGSTVVAYDFFRRIAVLLRKLIGGRFIMHETFMMRARREAVLRMAEDAQSRGAIAVHNIRLVSSNLGDNTNSLGGCEILAYGTAVWKEWDG